MDQPELPAEFAALCQHISERMAAGDLAAVLRRLTELLALSGASVGERPLGLKMGLAKVRLQTGDYAGAIAEGEQVLAARRRVLGDDHPLQDLGGRLLRRGPDDTTWLRNAYDRWVTAETRERIKESRKRRLRAKSKAAKRLSDVKYLQRWLSEREAQFPAWVRDYGGDGAEAVWDFSPDSLDALEDLVIERGSPPEQLLEDEQNAPFVDGALWYLGEVLRRTRPLPWGYVRGNTADPTVGHIDTREVLTGVLTLRRSRRTAPAV